MDNTFIFTYGSKGQPFEGGWTEVLAPDKETAIRTFEVFHPRRDGFLPCCSVYSLEEFKQTSMVTGNLGARCHEHIMVMRTLYGEAAYY